MDKKELYRWCSIPVDELSSHQTRIPFRIVKDSEEMGWVMARELLDEIKLAGQEQRKYRAIIPCGPNCWYQPFTEMVNAENISLKHLVVFHMDECLDWEGRLLSEDDPYNFKSYMLRHFYDPVREDLSVPERNRIFLSPAAMEQARTMIAEDTIDITYGGWGQDGHIAYNQTRRHPYSRTSLDELRNSGIRIQENNLDTIIALGQRTYGAAYQFAPPMSVTLGIKECLSAKKVRLFSDTGTWKQTAFRAALFSEPDIEYPITLLQEHPDALLTVTYDTAKHPISEHPEWKIKGVNI